MTKDPVANAHSQKAGELRVLAWAVFWTVLFLGAVGAYELFVPKAWPWSEPRLEPYMLTHAHDAWTHNGFLIQEIKNRDRSGEDELFVLVGGSVSRDAITNDSILSERLSDLAGRKIKFRSIAATYRSFTHDAQVVSELGAFGGILLIGVHPVPFMKGIERQLVYKAGDGSVSKNYHYLAVPAGIKSILLKYGYKDRPWQSLYSYKMVTVAGDLLTSYGVRVLSWGHGLRSMEYERHDDRPPPSEEKIREDRGIFKNRYYKEYSEFYEMNTELLKEIINIAQSNGNTVVLVDMPYDPAFDDEFSRFNPNYDNIISGIVREKGVSYIDTRDASEWAPEDFMDFDHMREPGRIKFAEALALKLADYLRTGGGSKNGL